MRHSFQSLLPPHISLVDPLESVFPSVQGLSCWWMTKVIASTSHPKVDIREDGKQGALIASPSFASLSPSPARTSSWFPLGGSALFLGHPMAGVPNPAQPHSPPLSPKSHSPPAWLEAVSWFCKLGFCLIPKHKIPCGYYCSRVPVWQPASTPRSFLVVRTSLSLARLLPGIGTLPQAQSLWLGLATRGQTPEPASCLDFQISPAPYSSRLDLTACWKCFHFCLFFFFFFGSATRHVGS